MEMSRGRLSSDDLPGELEDILESDNEPQQPEFYDSDEFDPTSLLVQPFFDDSNGDLDIDKEEFEELKEAPLARRNMPSQGNTGMNPSSFQQHNITMNFQDDQHQQQQQQLQQTQQQQQQNNFSFQQNNAMGPSSNQMLMNPATGSPTPDTGTHDSLSPQRRAINFQVQEVQRKIQQVQQEIERVQLESNSCMVGSLPQQQPQHQQPLPIPSEFSLQTLGNPAGMTRNAPGRSVSMPIRRNHMLGNPISHPTFMMQQPMDLLQQQQAMMGNSNGSSTQGHMDNMQGFRQTSHNMDQLQLMMGNNSIDGSLHSPVGNNNTVPGFIQARAMDQKHTMMTTSSLDGSYQSIMNSSHGVNQTVSLDSSGNSILTNLHGSMHGSMQGFNNQGLDTSAHSIKNNNTMNASSNMEMDTNNMMMLMMQRQQGLDNMSSMPNIGFGDGGTEMFHNSFPQVNSSGIGMISPQGDLGGGVSHHYDLLQMQRSFQGQGIISSPIGQQGQATAGAQTGVNGAMEKLCESMRRSAMSRSLVKQLSGHSISRNGSNRAITKQHSGRGLSRQFSGASSSGRQIVRTSSGRQGIVDGGLELPVRRSNHDPKHRLQRDVLATSSLHNPRRGVFRNHSQSAAMGGSSNKTVVNIDGNSIGMF